ncbi:hypothetical protein I4U23_012242 [Adineta vaga]|nr:hypothetical protein I4U23_012242 [Adineta vaga]
MDVDVDPYVDSDPKPTEVTDSFWLFEYNEEIARNSPSVDGKWLQFYDLSQLDTMWEYAKAKYRAGRLIGIHSLKVSTGRPNQRASNASQGVIIFYCGPSVDEQRIRMIGQKLLEEIYIHKEESLFVCLSIERTALIHLIYIELNIFQNLNINYSSMIPGIGS